MATFILKLEAMPGDHIADVAREAARLSRLLGVHVDFPFNDVDCFVRPYDDPTDVVARYHAEFKTARYPDDTPSASPSSKPPTP